MFVNPFNKVNKVINHEGIELEIGDKIQIVSENLKEKSLGMLTVGEVITITSFSEDGKILYYHNSLALSVNSNVYIKYETNKN